MARKKLALAKARLETFRTRSCVKTLEEKAKRRDI
jgi:hypothetical protein